MSARAKSPPPRERSELAGAPKARRRLRDRPERSEWPRSNPTPGGSDQFRSAGRGLAGLELDEVAVDLAQGDRERLLLRGGLDERAYVLEQALTELAVVGVDLTRPLRGDDHQRVLRLGAVEQLVDGRVGDAFGS